MFAQLLGQDEFWDVDLRPGPIVGQLLIQGNLWMWIPGQGKFFGHLLSPAIFWGVDSRPG